MSDITKVSASPVQAAPVPALSQVNGGKGQKTGNDLPPVADLVAAPAAPIVNSQTMQEQVQAAVAQMNEYIQSTQRDLNFSYDPDSGETVVKVLDRETQEVIRQIPDEIFLRLSQRLAPDEPVSLFSAQA